MDKETGLELCTNGVSRSGETTLTFPPLFRLLALGTSAFCLQNCKRRCRCGLFVRTKREGGACLPLFWYGQQDLNLHISRYKILNLARLPISPCPRMMRAWWNFFAHARVMWVWRNFFAHARFFVVFERTLSFYHDSPQKSRRFLKTRPKDFFIFSQKTDQRHLQTIFIML